MANAPFEQNRPPASSPASSSNNASKPEPTLVQGLQTVQVSPTGFKSLVHKPCVRDSLLVGLGAGFGIGGTRFIFSSRPQPYLAPGMTGGTSRTSALAARQWRAMSWAIGAFVIGSAGMHLFCQRRRQLERESMKLIQEAISTKKEEKRQQLQEKNRKAAGAKHEGKGV